MKALVLSGGGGRSVFELGVLRKILEKNPNFDYDIYTGVSAGAINASILASGPLKETLSKLENIWLNEIKGNHSIWTHHLWWYILFGICLISLFIIFALLSFIFDLNKFITMSFILLSFASFYLPYYSLKNTKSVYKTDPLKKLIIKHLDVDKLKLSGKKLSIGSLCYETGEYRSVYADNENIVEWILASSAFPLFFPMVKIDGLHWTDAGLVNAEILYDAMHLGATEIDVIICHSVNPEQHNRLGLFTQFERTLNLMATEILNNDLIICKNQNINIRVFIPEKSLGNSSLNFNPDKIKKIYDIGKNTKPIIIRKK